MNGVERWLEPRLADTPKALRQRILEAVSGGEKGFTLQDELRRAGERLLSQAIAAPPSRDTAVTLLAADALMTFACEAIAESHPEDLADFGVK